jgi:hypothetical protein
MPNGGSDCCATCWFNSKNAGEQGYHGMRKPGDVQCVIRGMTIPDPFWTYCDNHPRAEYFESIIFGTEVKPRTELIGPVYVAPTREEREIWVEGHDTEQERLRLLKFLTAIPYSPEEYSKRQKYFGDTAVLGNLRLLGLLKEKRAVDGLNRIIGYLDLAKITDDASFYSVLPWRIDASIIGTALEALSMIVNDEALPKIESFVQLHTESDVGCENDLSERSIRLSNDLSKRLLRLSAVKALEHCSSEKANSLLHKASLDPNPVLAALAKEIREKKGKRGK